MKSTISGEVARDRVYLGVLTLGICIVAGRLWLPQLDSSFWLDETGTAWLIQGDLWDAVSRSVRFQGGHTLFVIVEWLVKQVVGLREVGLRLPSVVGMAGTAYLIYAFGRRQYDMWVGLVGALIFVCLPAVAFAASDARPYALALAALTGSTVALVRWSEDQTTRNALIYAAAFAVTALLHYLFLLALASHAIYLLYRIRAGQGPDLKKLALVGTAMLLFLVPAAPAFFRILGERSSLSNPYQSEPRDIFNFLIPTGLLYLLVAAFLVAAVIGGAALQRNGYRAGTIPLLIAWVAIPCLVLFEISNRTATNVFVPRYFLMITPAIALLLAMGVRQLSSRTAQIAVVALLALFAFRHHATTTHTLEDWRSAAAVEREIVTDRSTPVLLFSGFIEGNQIGWLSDPEKAAYLNAPAAMYSMEGRLIPTPFSLEGAGVAYMEQIVRDHLLKTDRFVLVTRGTDPYNAWLSSVLSPEGFSATLVASFSGEILVYEYSRA